MLTIWKGLVLTWCAKQIHCLKNTLATRWCNFHRVTSQMVPTAQQKAWSEYKDLFRVLLGLLVGQKPVLMWSEMHSETTHPVKFLPELTCKSKVSLNCLEKVEIIKDLQMWERGEKKWGFCTVWRHGAGLNPFFVEGSFGTWKLLEAFVEMSEVQNNLLTLASHGVWRGSEVEWRAGVTWKASKVEDLGILKLSSHREVTQLAKWTTVLKNGGGLSICEMELFFPPGNCGSHLNAHYVNTNFK